MPVNSPETPFRPWPSSHPMAPSAGGLTGLFGDSDTDNARTR